MSFRRGLVLSILLFVGGVANVFAQPSISSFSPTFGSSSDPNFININGSGFSPGTLIVKFNGAQATASATSSSLIQARVPAAAPLGSGKIFVQVGANSTLSGQDFTVIGPGPYVSDFTPVTGSAGSVVTLHGSHFTGVTSVKFNGQNAATVNLQSDIQIQATAPAGVSSGPLLVTASSGSYSTSTNGTTTNFYVSPVLKGFSPNSGRPGTNVVITGTNLLGTSSVQFGAISGTGLLVLSNGAVQITVPTGAQSSQITLTAPAGAAITSSNFLVQPTVTGFTPASGPSGTLVTVSGANFLGLTSVQFNGVSSPSVTGVAADHLTSSVPASATSGPITVNTTNGSSTSVAIFYVPASVMSFTPNTGPPGSIIKITGNNFTGATSVSFNGTPASNFWITNNTTIGAMIPPGVSTGPVSVTTPAGVATSSGNFFAAPGITSFNPTHGLPGTNVVITGINFLGATIVKFNGLSASFVTPTNNTTLVATVPANATTGPITVGAPGGTNSSPGNFVLDYSSELSLGVTTSPSAVFIGSNFTYTITVANNGPFAAPNVQLTNTLPASVVLKSSTTSQGSLNTAGNPIVGSLGSLPMGGLAVVTLTVTPQAAGNITNSVTVSSDYNDPVASNNSTNLVTTVLPLPLLSIKRSGTTQVQVSWPVLLTNFALQFNTNLSLSGSWSNDTTVPVISGGENVVTEPKTNATRFFRLHQ